VAEVRALVITGFGLNCEAETAHALERAGASAALVHLNDLLDPSPGGPRLEDFHILVFVGGFSFGDHIGAGTVFANRLRHRLAEPLHRFIRSGRLVLGICNGFQVMVKLGLLPGFDGDYTARRVTLAWNDCGTFRDHWVHLRADPESPCIFTRGIERLYLPIRHGEGKLLTDSDATRRRLAEQRQVALQYVHPEDGRPTDAFPWNPNGSVDAIAGICDPTGRIFGLMPHPEAYHTPFNHPRWTRQKIEGTLPEEGQGMRIFRNAVAFAREAL